MINNKASLILIVYSILFHTGCKRDWLDAKPDTRLSLVTTVDEYSKLMDNSTLNSINLFVSFGTDEYYVSEDNLAFISAQNVPYYTWAPDGLALNYDPYWKESYLNIFTCNVAIEGLNKIQKTVDNEKEWDYAFGAALFFRGIHYFQLSQIFIESYTHTTASIDMGLPIRTQADVTQAVSRGSVQDVYDRILNDLNTALKYLPDVFNQYKSRPSKQAVYGYLSRIFMSMEDYDNALKYADSALSISQELLDYNNVISSTALGFASHSFQINPEVFFTCSSFSGGTVLDIAYMRVDSALFNSYHSNDLRKTIFFRPREIDTYSFKGTYLGAGQSSGSFFMAPATDELYLNKAECLARKGLVPQAMSTLNSLLSKRWASGTFVNFSADNAETALNIILTERKKELVMRGVRWSDLRRFNKDQRLQTTIHRAYKGVNYELQPNSNLYIWPLPNDEITIGKLPQNPR